MIMTTVRRLFPSMAALLLLGSLPLATHCMANPGWGGGGWNGGGGYYRPCYGSGWGGGYYYRGGCNPDGWYGTGIPNGLGWTMFGLAAASGLAAGTACAAPAYGGYYAPAPVYAAPAPVIVQQPVVVQPVPAVQAPLVNYNGVLCYYVNGNYYPANPVK